MELDNKTAMNEAQLVMIYDEPGTASRNAWWFFGVDDQAT
jgi:hypothetical protein